MAYITLPELKEYLGMKTSTTFTADAGTDMLTLASVKIRQNMNLRDAVQVTTTDTLPAPLAVDTFYYVISTADQTIQLATTSALATAGTNINLTDAGLGVHTITKAINDESLLDEAISDAQEYIDTETNRVFEAVTATKYYDKTALYRYNNSVLFINEDLLTITTLTNGDSSDTVITNTQYWLGGVDDKALDRNLGTPYHAIKLTEDSGVYWTWDTDGWVSILGTWGFSTTAPSDIKQAMFQLSAYFFRLKDSQVFDVTTVPEMGQLILPKGIPVGVVKIITKYKRYF